jgi:outer membrane protein assembly factor BamA
MVARMLLSAAGFLAFVAFAEPQSDTPMDVTDGGPYAREKGDKGGEDAELGGVPALFRTPETGLGGGAVLIYIPAGGDGGKVSSALGGALYTEKKQFLSALYVEQYFGRDRRWVGEVYVALQNYPDSFFGIGNDTNVDDEEHYTWRQSKAAGTLRYLFTEDFRAGLSAVNEENAFSKLEAGGMLDSGEVYGVDGGAGRALGLTARYDTLDDGYAPTSGQVASLSYLRYAPLFGSDFDFSTTDLNLKTFHALSASDVVGAQLFAGYGTGDTPFFSLYQMGGKNLLRGYYYGRFRDRNMLVGQTEWRHRLHGPWGAAVFAGAGDVAREKDGFNAAKLKPAGGFGLRYQLVERTKINVRLDFGFGRGEDNPSVYLYILEAF